MCGCDLFLLPCFDITWTLKGSVSYASKGPKCSLCFDAFQLKTVRMAGPCGQSGRSAQSPAGQELNRGVVRATQPVTPAMDLLSKPASAASENAIAVVSIIFSSSLALMQSVFAGLEGHHRMLEKGSVKPFVAPEETACNLINYLPGNISGSAVSIMIPTVLQECKVRPVDFFCKTWCLHNPQCNHCMCVIPVYKITCSFLWSR